MTGYPVQDNSDTPLVTAVNKGHKVPGMSMAAGGRIITHGLVAPGTVKGMLHDGQKFNMGVPHIYHIIHQFLC